MSDESRDTTSSDAAKQLETAGFSALAWLFCRTPVSSDSRMDRFPGVLCFSGKVHSTGGGAAHCGNGQIPHKRRGCDRHASRFLR